MKMRSGFVSNSSSSSFIIAFEKKPKNVQELAEVLYPDGVGVGDPYGEHSIDADSAAGYVWDQIKDKTPLTKLEVVEEISSGYFDGHPEFPFGGEDSEVQREYKRLTGKNINDDDTPKEWRNRWNKAWRKKIDDYDKANKEAATVLSERLLKGVFKGKKLFNCSFSDNDGPIGSIMEHGDTFRSVPHTTISHH